MTSRTVFPGIPILASKGFLGKLDREDKVREWPSAPRLWHVPKDQLAFSSASGPICRSQGGCCVSRDVDDCSRGRVVTGTSVAPESTFPVVKGHVVNQKPSGNTPLPPSTAMDHVYSLVSSQREGFTLNQLGGSSSQSLFGNFFVGDPQQIT